MKQHTCLRNIKKMDTILFVLGLMAYFIGVAFVFMLYMLPWVIARIRYHKNAASIFVFNFIFGWTILGWLIALVWCFSSNVQEEYYAG